MITRPAISKQSMAIAMAVCSIWIMVPSAIRSAAGHAGAPVILTGDQHEYPLGMHLAFIEDSSGKLAIEDVADPEYAERFTPGSEDVTNLGMMSSVFWIRIPIRNESRNTDDWLLRIENSYFDIVEVYIPNSDTHGPAFTVKRSGDSVPFREWDIAYRQFVFNVFLRPGTELTIYIRIENADGMISRLSLLPAGAFIEIASRRQLWYGIYFGSLCIMALYNFFIFLSLRDQSYLHYVLFVISWGIKEFCAEGFAYQYLWPGFPQWNEPISHLLGSLSGFFALLFTSHFLKLPDLNPKLHKITLLLCLGWIVSYFVTEITDLGVATVFIHVVTLGSLAIVVVAPAVSWRRGYGPARYLLLAWASLAVTGTASILTSFGVLPSNTILLYSYPVGVVMLMLMLSWALADRINELKRRAEQKRLRELELRQAKSLAEAANHAKSVFLANMSHELRTPLNAMLGFAQVIARNPYIPPEEHNNLDIIRRSGEHLMTLINQVLDLSKIEAGRITLNEDDFDFHRLLDEICRMFTLKAENKNLRLVFERDDNVPKYIRADEMKLRQVLINLLGNAIKFTEEGAIQLSVNSYQLAVTSEQLSVNKECQEMKNDLCLAFTIRDTGLGIAADEMDGVFEAFGQTDTGRRMSEGTGLGLPISRKFVRLMGGDIHVDSEAGKGATFMFDIRTREVGAAATTPPTRRVVAVEPGQPRCRMLIVDDNRYNRQLLFKLLSPFGFELREAANGLEAVEIWETWMPQLIWMDIRMPTLNGYEATKTIRKQERNLPQNTNRKTPTIIIAVTASSFEEDQAGVLAAGCDDFLRKPFRDTEIFEIVENHLGIRFAYEGEKQSADAGPKADEKDAPAPETLAALPASLLESLGRGAYRADYILLTKMVGKIRKHDPELSDALKRLVDDFKYDDILALIRKAGGNYGP